METSEQPKYPDVDLRCGLPDEECALRYQTKRKAKPDSLWYRRAKPKKLRRYTLADVA